MDKYKPLNEVYELAKQANLLLIKIWYSQILFSWRWWLEIILTFIPWIIWIKYRDRKQSLRLLFTGLIVAIITNALDIIGDTFNLWHYDWKVLPFIPIYISLGTSLYFLLL